MNVLMIGGFLGSGKTTIIRSLIKGLVASGQTCAIIENEIGEVGIDDALIGEAGLEVTPLFGGCVCCTISGSLITAVERIEDEINPDWIIVEMTGLALMNDIRRTFGKYGRESLNIHTVSVVDASRWRVLTGPLVQVFDFQVAGADTILLNKIDIAPPTEEMYAGIKERSPDGIILEIDAQTIEPEELWEHLLQSFEAHKSGVKDGVL